MPTYSAHPEQRMAEYVASFTDLSADVRRRWYPLPPRSSPWVRAEEVPFISILEYNFPVIEREILRIENRSFHREVESIGRAGSWDVLFIYERGRFVSENCALLPQTTAVVQGLPYVRGHEGMVYVSRLRPQTRIVSHRGPTNLRARCHLPIVVPTGDCALSVDGQVRNWERGKCLTFDDSLDHEVWNLTDSDRIVLVVDFWNPELTSGETDTLAGLGEYVAAHSRDLHAFWSSNEEARKAG